MPCLFFLYLYVFYLHCVSFCQSTDIEERWFFSHVVNHRNSVITAVLQLLRTNNASYYWYQNCFA